MVREISTGFRIPPDSWNENKQSIKKTYPNYDLITIQLKALEADYLKKLLEAERHDSSICAQKLKDLLAGKNQVSKQFKTVHQFWTEKIELLYRSGRNGNPI